MFSQIICLILNFHKIITVLTKMQTFLCVLCFILKGKLRKLPGLDLQYLAGAAVLLVEPSFIMNYEKHIKRKKHVWEE